MKKAKNLEQLITDRARLRAEAATLLTDADRLQMQADGVLAQRNAVLNQVDKVAGKIHKLNLDINTLATVQKILTIPGIKPVKMTLDEIENVGEGVQLSNIGRAA